MSWIKRPQGGTVPPPGHERQSFNTSQSQPFGNQESMYPNYSGGGENMQPQQQYWQMSPQQHQPPQYSQQYGQPYQQQDYPSNANQFYPQQAYNNMNYASQGFSNTQQTGYQQQNFYPNQGLQNQGQQQNFAQTKPKADGWDDNWDWGWGEDSSKQMHKGSQPPNPVQQPLPHQHQGYNNANIIEQSFNTPDSNCWNWAMDDNKDIKEPVTVPSSHEPLTVPVSNAIVENTNVPELSAPRTASNMSAQQAEEVNILNNREVVKERLSNLASGKRFHLENLTPQWSIESQMSQESTDGIHTHSEETYRSENHSRNSNKSSPGLNTDHLNYPQTALDESLTQNSEWSRPTDDLTVADSKNNSRRPSHDELASSMKEMSLTNHQNLSTSNLGIEISSKNIQEISQPAPGVLPASLPTPVSSSLPLPPTQAMPPAPPISSVPLASLTPSIALTAPPSSCNIPPPNFPPPTSNSNPFKHAGPFSHKSLGKGSTSSSSVQSFPQPQISNTNLTSPAVVNKVSQHNRVPVGFEANLETTPDNSERPDQPQVSGFKTLSVSQQVPDNMEVAPRSDRNEYLQTAHLSSGDFGENTDFSRGVPPPGLRRMVVGQQESEYSQNLNISGDEPPPGLARMVPGQQTEVDSGYNQPGDNYLDRHIDGQTTENSVRPYRQADGQQTLDSYNQPPPSRVTERRPVGLDRLVPGEPSNDEYSQYQSSSYSGANEERVVTGVDHEFSITTDSVHTAVREQNMDGSDYTEQSLRNPSRNIIGVRESNSDVSPDFNALPDEQQREVTVGQNLQDLSMISSGDLTYSRENVLDGADVTITDGNDRKTDLSDSIDHQASSSRKQSLNRVNTSGEDSERDRAFKSSPRRDKHKSSRDRERDRDRDRDKDGRYLRGDRKYDPERRSTRNDRHSAKDKRDREGYRDRRDREQSPDARRYRRSTRSHRYETEDTDYYSDRERDRRRHRESSYTSSKPPRPDDKDRRYDDRDRSKRYNTIERDRRNDDERESRRRSDRYREREHYERSYRDIDPTRKHGNIRRQREKDDPRRVVTFSPEAKTNDSCNKGDFSSPSRPDSRDATVTDEDGAESRRRDRRSRRTAEPYYDEYAGGGAYAEAYLAQRQQYQYYEHLRVSNPAAYMVWYKQYMAGLAPHQTTPAYVDEFGSMPYDSRQERGSVHSGRSSTTGVKGNETYYGAGRYRHDAASLRDAPSLRTDVSDRDMSLNFTHLEESTVRSERMTPFRYSTAHIKGSIASRDVVVVRPSYPVDGAPATVHVVSLAATLAHLPDAAELAAFPGPLVKGVTHKMSVIEYCSERVRSGTREGGRDVTGYVLVWQLLALCLRQNGVVVGSDIAELLMKNTREYELKANKIQNESSRGSSASGEGREASSSPEQPSVSVSDSTNQEPTSAQSAVSERLALNRLRELLEYGNRQEAIEWAMSSGLWGHAWALAAHAERRTRGLVAARFLSSVARRDPVHSLYAALAGAPPPAATCVADERWGDWRPHAAILLANPSAKPDQDKRNLTQLGDSLASRGLVFSAQFCYLSAGVQFAPHPLAPLSPAPTAPNGGGGPPRLSLLLADPRSTSLQQLATNRALFATEVYEYALSLSQDDFVIPELQPYKLVLSCRLVDCGRYERALAYAEAAARALTRRPRLYPLALVQRLAALADRLKHHDPALHEELPLADDADSAEPSPRHQQWLHDVQSVAHMLHAEAEAESVGQVSAQAEAESVGQVSAQAEAESVSQVSAQASPRRQHDNYYGTHHTAQQYGWAELHQAQQYQQVQPAVPTYAEGVADQHQQHQQQEFQLHQQQQQQQVVESVGPTVGEQFPQYEEQHAAHQYADPYWHTEQPYSGYGEVAGAVMGGEEIRPNITMPGESKPRTALYDYDDDRPPSNNQNERDPDTPKTSAKKQESKPSEENKNESKGGKGGGWLGGILNKLSLRAPNQMILPDDKNPSIVWDAENKRWRSAEGADEQPAQPPAPPPRTADLPRALQSAVPTLTAAAPPPGAPVPAIPAAPVAPVSNIFKMQKGRHIKNSYVDVFNPSGAAPRPLPPAADVLGPAPPAPPPAYFVPAPQHAQANIPRAIQTTIPSSCTLHSRPRHIPPPMITHKNDQDAGMYSSGI